MKATGKRILENEYVLTNVSTLTRTFMSLQPLFQHSRGKEATSHVATCVFRSLKMPTEFSFKGKGLFYVHYKKKKKKTGKKAAVMQETFV